MARPGKDYDHLYLAVRADLSPGLQIAQSVHAAFHFARQWPALTATWLTESEYLVVVSAPDELALANLATAAVEEGIAVTIWHEPDLDNEITAVALEAGPIARRLCAQLPTALRDAKVKAQGDLTMV